MKNIKAWGLIFLALLVGLGAAVHAARWAASQGQGALGQVVVAAVDIEPGSRISPQMLAVQGWPSGALPAGAFGDAKALHERVLKVGVLKGEAIVECWCRSNIDHLCRLNIDQGT